MTHPHQQSHAMLAARFKHTAMTVVVNPLCQFGKLLHILRFAVTLCDDFIERSCTLRTLQCIVMHTPFVALRPKSFWRECAQEALVGHDIRHTAFAVELVIAGFHREIGFSGQHPIRPMSAHHFVGRTGYVMQIRMTFCYNATQCFVNHFRRKTFITSAIKADGSVVANPFHIVFGIVDEHLRVIRIGTVSRIGQPKVLPNHDSVPVASFIEFFVANHTYPVAHHRKVHVSMIGNRCLVFASAVVEIRFPKSPVTASSDKTTTVDIKIQYLIVFIESHLANADLKVTLVRYLPVNHECKVGII